MCNVLWNMSVGGATVDIDWSGIYHGTAQPTATAKVCDTVTFKWTGYHNVYKSAGAEGYEAGREAEGEMVAPATTGGAYSVTFEKPGSHFYICLVGNHCSGTWQKVAITVEGEGNGSGCSPSSSGDSSNSGDAGSVNPSNADRSTGILAGAIAGGLVGGLVLLVGVWRYYRRCRTTSKGEDPNAASATPRASKPQAFDEQLDLVVSRTPATPATV